MIKLSSQVDLVSAGPNASKLHPGCHHPPLTGIATHGMRLLLPHNLQAAPGGLVEE